MPQMSPLWWLLIFSVTMFIFILFFCNKNHFKKKFYKKSYMKPNQKKLLW